MTTPPNSSWPPPPPETTLTPQRPSQGTSAIAKAAILFACLAGISLGLCGLNAVFVFAMPHNGGRGGQTMMRLGIFELIGFGIGVLGLVVTGIAAIVVAVTKSMQRQR